MRVNTVRAGGGWGSTTGNRPAGLFLLTTQLYYNNRTNYICRVPGEIGAGRGGIN